MALKFLNLEQIISGQTRRPVGLCSSGAQRKAKREDKMFRLGGWRAAALALGAVAAPGAAAWGQAVTPAAAAPVASTATAFVLNSGDTAWMLASTGLVLMMTIPGLALFYGGMVRKKNVIATVAQSFAMPCVVPLVWFVVTYSIAFGTNSD